MEPEIYDAIVIGSGQGGRPLSIALAKAGWHTAIIEREHIGGTCVNVGCTPTKTMVASARVASRVARPFTSRARRNASGSSSSTGYSSSISSSNRSGRSSGVSLRSASPRASSPTGTPGARGARSATVDRTAWREGAPRRRPPQLPRAPAAAGGRYDVRVARGARTGRRGDAALTRTASGAPPRGRPSCAA